MTPMQARQYLFDNSHDGGIYKQQYLFVFNVEDYEKTLAILEIADGGRGVWAGYSGSFNASGVTLCGNVSGVLPGFIVVGTIVRTENLFAPGYLQHALNTATHELVHAAQFSIKIQSYHDTLKSVEPLAYLTGWLMEKWIFALYKKHHNVIAMLPGPAVDTGMAYTTLFGKLYNYQEQRLMGVANQLSAGQMYHALVRETISSMNTTVVVEPEAWSSTTYFEP